MRGVPLVVVSAEVDSLFMARTSADGTPGTLESDAGIAALLLPLQLGCVILLLLPIAFVLVDADVCCLILENNDCNKN